MNKLPFANYKLILQDETGKVVAELDDPLELTFQTEYENYNLGTHMDRRPISLTVSATFDIKQKEK